MQTILHPNAQVTLVSPSGARRSVDGQADNDEIRGDALDDIHALAQAGDTILLGPGRYAQSLVTGKEDLTIVGVPGRTFLVPRAGENSVRYHPRSGQRFVDLGSDAGAFIFYKSEGDIVDPDDVTDVWIVNCHVQGGEDLIYIDQSGDGSIVREWHVIGGKYLTRNTSGSANDALFFGNAAHTRVTVENAEIDVTGTITGGLDMMGVQIGGVGAVLEVSNCRIRCAPTGNPIPQPVINGACVMAANGGTAKVKGCRLITQPGPIPKVYAVAALLNGVVELARGNCFEPYSTGIFLEHSGGSIVNVDHVAP